MPGYDADYGSQIAEDHHLPVCLRRLGVMTGCQPSLPQAGDNLLPHVSHTRLPALQPERGEHPVTVVGV